MENRVEILRNYIDEILLNMSDTQNRRCAYLHLYGVAQACALIALRRDEDVELATMAGMLHDLYTYKTGNHADHAIKGAVLAREILTELKLTNEIETNMICSAIHNHSSKEENFSSFDEVLIDADVLQHVLYNFSLPILEQHKSSFKNRFEKLSKEFELNIHK
ncbi:MAG: HD domain-containing protein [Erysipelotrichales bacterium]|nr:HD domain-containing protein [Erysipelotrichales bacterium]